MPNEQDPHYAVLLKANDQIVCILEDKETIRGFDTLQDGLGFYERGFQRAHSMGHEYSTGAMLYWMQCQPAIAEFTDLNDLRNRVLGPAPHSVTRLSSVAVHGVMGIICTGDGAHSAWENAQKPALIGQRAVKTVNPELIQVRAAKREIRKRVRYRGSSNGPVSRRLRITRAR